MAAPKMLNPDSAAGNAKIKAPVVKKPKVAVVKRPASSAETARAAGLKAGTVGAANPLKLLASEVTRSRENAFEFLTGIQTRGNKVKVDPLGLAMALPVGKVIRAAKALKAVGKIGESEALAARVAAKSLGGSRKALQATREARTLYWPAPKDLQYMGRGTSGKAVRGISEKVFPRRGVTQISELPVSPSAARAASKSFGSAASSEIGIARSLRGVPGEKGRSLRMFKEGQANIRAGRQIRNAGRQAK